MLQTEDLLERRLVTILAADAVGYSGMMAEDEAAAFTRLNRSREIIDQAIQSHSGRVFGSAGDSVLAEFASSVNATECAIDIQQRLMAERSNDESDPVLQFRIGINFGDVIAKEDNLLGDGVNIASRLEGLAPTNGLCVAGNVREQVAGKIKSIEFGHCGSHHLKNIDRPVDVWCWPASEAGELRRLAIGKSRKMIGAVLAAALLIASVLGIVFFEFENQPATDAEKVSLAVMPFANVGRDPKQDYFVDGITSDLITDLSRVSGLLLIARSSTFTYKGQSVPPNQLASELGVRYILEGSIRQSADRIRINSQLIDTETGAEVWADRFDRELGEVFTLQDDITDQIVQALELELTANEKESLDSSRRQVSPEAYDLFLKGSDELRRFTTQSTADARLYFLRSLAIEPQYARAYASLAFSYTSSSLFFVANENEEAVLSALNYGLRSLELDPTLPQGYFSVALARLRQKEFEAAEAAAKKAIEYDPNYSDGFASLSAILSYSGRGQEAETEIRRAMVLNPRYSAAYIDILGRALFIQKRYPDALEQFDLCIDRDVTSLTCHVLRTATHGLMGELGDASWGAEEILNLDPDFNLTNNPLIDQFHRNEDRKLLTKGLTAAGIPLEPRTE